LDRPLESARPSADRRAVVKLRDQSVVLGVDFEKTGDVKATTVRWVGVAIDCVDAGSVARFYERLLGYEIGDFEPRHCLRSPLAIRESERAGDCGAKLGS